MFKRLSVALVAESKAGTLNQSDTESTVTDTTQSIKLPRPSLANVVLSRKFAKRLSARMLDRKLGGSVSGGLQPEKEPTYRMEPKKKFKSPEVEKAVKDIIDCSLDGVKYNPKACSNLIKSLSDEIKDRVKLLGFERYKIVCVIMLTPAVEQGLMATSRCTWDKNNDTYVTYTFRNSSVVCNATVFGVYRE